MARAHPRRAQAGFTLLEVLVALTLLALVLAAGTGAIGQIGEGFARGTQRVEQVQDLALARDVLRRQAARALPVVEGGVDRARYLFEGTADSVVFPILEAPAPGRGGPALARFAVEPSPLGRRLVYSQRPLEGGPERRSVLAEGPYGFRLSYLGRAADGAVGWRDAWDTDAALPLLIRLEMTVEGRAVPAAVARFRADAERGCVLLLGEGFCRDLAGGGS